MNKIGKYIFILVIVLLIFIGGVYASDNNQSSTVSVTADDADDLVTVDTSVADEGKVVDVDDAAVTNQTVKAVEVTDELKETSGENNVVASAFKGEVLGASSDKDVLRAPTQGSFKDLRDKIGSAGNSYTLSYSFKADDGTFGFFDDFNWGFYTGNSVPRSGIVISKDFTLQGNGNYVINGNKLCRIFDLTTSGTTVTFRNIIFQNGGYSNYAGGIINIASGVTVVFDYCTFETSSSTQSGGAVYTASDKVTFKDCTFKSNTAASGGAISIAQNGAVSISGSTFRSNSASAGGGAIYAAANAKELKIDKSLFDDNHAKGQGGAIHYAQGTSKLNMTNSNFTNNYVETASSGDTFGGVFSYHGNNAADSYLYIDNCIMSGSSSPSAHSVTQAQGTQNGKTHILNSRFESNSANGAHSTVCLTNMTGAIVDNCVFKDNTVKGAAEGTANRGAGALYIRDSQNVVITNCEFTHNVITGTFDGGAIFVYDKASVKEIINCSFDRNVAPGNGGAFYTTLSLTNTLFEGCNFTSNTAGSKGGAVYVYDGSRNVTFDDCKFEYNNATVSGSAVYVGEGIDDLNVINCTFTANRITSVNTNKKDGGGALYIPSGNDILIEGSTFTDNNANGCGGAISIWGTVSETDGNFTIRRSHFNTNTATYASTSANDVKLADGGAVFISYEAVHKNSKIIDCTFNGNRVNYTANGNVLHGGTGGAVSTGVQPDGSNKPNWRSSYNTNISIINSNFTNNYASQDGSAVFLVGIQGIVKDSTFTGNNASVDSALFIITSASKFDVIDSTFSDNYAGQHGAALMYGSPNGEITGCTFNDNEAIRGGAIFLDSYYSGTSNKTISYSSFTGNDAKKHNNNDIGVSGGAVFVQGNDDPVTHIVYSNFTENTAVDEGGAIYWQTKYDFNTTNCIFTDNTAGTYGGAIWLNRGVSNIDVNYCSFTGNDATNNEGGAIYFFTGGNTFNINTCNFTDNTAKIYGGAVYCYYNTADNGNITKVNITDSVFTHNTAGNGGALLIHKVNSIDIDGSSFINNDVSGNGGALFSYDVHTININDSTFEDNDASGLGGALTIYSSVSSTTINGSTFNDNDADSYGGAAYIGSKLTVDDSSFDSNTAIGGGAIYCHADNPKIYSSNFTANNATGSSEGYGGAVYIIGNNAVVSDSYFKDNNAVVNGGALAIKGSNSNVDYCEFVSNSAESGGAVYIEGDGTLSNSNFTGNSAKTNGGAVYWKGNNANIAHSQFDENKINNQLGGGAICIDGNNAQITYSDFTNNSALSAGAIYLKGSSNVVSNSNFTDNHVTADGGAIYIAGDNNSVTDSTFTGNDAGNHGGAIFIAGDSSKIITDNFVNNTANVNGNTIWVESGASNNISKSNFTGTKHIYINSGSTTLMENRELSDIDADYTVYNKGTLSLYSTNKFNNIIYNNGIIDTTTYANVTKNTTYEDWDEWSFPAYAHVYDQDNNTILSVQFTYVTYINGVKDKETAAANNVTHNATISLEQYTYLLSATDDGLTALTVHTSLIKVIPKVGSYTWLQEQIDNLQTNTLVLTQNVTFNATYDLHPNNPYYGKINFTYGMLYNKTFDFEGSGYTISGNNSARIFIINASNIKINNTKFVNGSADNGGSLLFSKSVENINITNSNFTDNTARVSGGAIYFTAQSQNILIENSTFDKNDAPEGGAIKFNANALYNNIDIIKSNFTNNKATGTSGEGGSAIVFVMVSDVYFDQCIFEANEAQSTGALKFNGYRDIYYNECEFTDNEASNGGAMYYTYSRTTDPHSDVTCFKCNFTDNEASNGGAMYVVGDDFNVRDCDFTGNKALVKNGGAMYVIGDDCNVIACDFTNNYAKEWAGAVIVGDSTHNTNRFNVINSTFTNNTAFYAGAFDSYYSNNTHLVNSTFDNNSAVYGGAVYMTGHFGLIDNCNFTKNHATNGSALAYYPKGVNQVGETRANITNCRFEDNVAGEVATLWFQSSHGRIVNCDFINNTADTAAGVYVSIDGVTITESRFTDNNVTGSGGAVYVTSEASPNTDYSSDHKPTDISYCNFTGNYAGADGGAVYFVAGKGIINMSCFTGNEALNGGAIYSTGGNLTVTYSNFTENHARNEGGAIYAVGEGSIISHSNFINNTATNSGGAVVLAGNNQKVLYSTFKDNKAQTGSGGAVYVKQKEGVYIEYSYFENNFAHYNGGAVYNPGTRGARVYVQYNEFVRNIAEHNGGAIYYVVDSDNPTYAKAYRDYHNFDGQGIINAGKTTVTMHGDSEYSGRLVENILTDNIDYLLNVTGYCPNATNKIEVVISNPRDPDRNSIRIIVNLTSITPGKDLFRTIVVDSSSFNNHITNAFNYITNETTITFYNLTLDCYYNVTVSFEDANYMIKEANYSNILVGHDRKGDFHILQDKINQALKRGDTRITLDTDYTFTDEIFNGVQLDDCYMNITGTLIIDGNGHTINAKGYCKIFEITGANVTLTRIVFVNGNANGVNDSGSNNGGAIYWKGANGTIYDCDFMNNTADNGGAVFVDNDGEFGTINKTYFEYNHASGKGGAVDWNASNGKIVDSTFKDNWAQYGGAAFRGSQSAMGYGHNNTFINNYAEINGGAMDWNSTGGNVTDCKFYNNHAGQNGGAIFVGAHGGSGRISNSVFENNYVNETSGRGGAVDWYAAGEIFDSTFTNNRAAYGGAVFIGKNGGTGNITNCNFTSNYARHNGGAIDWNATSGTLTNSTFKYNTADYGGAVFRGSEAKNGAGTNNTFIGNHANVNGGAVDWNASAGTVSGYKFINNTADGNGGAVFVGASSNSSKILNSYFEGNNATGRGGAVDWYASSGDIEGSTFKNNHAYLGGGLFMGQVSSNCTIFNSLFEGNTATLYGGAIDCNATRMRLENTTFKYNEAQFGAALCRGTFATGGYGYNNTFIANHAYEAGAALGWLGAVSININNYKFINNSADKRGGAIYVGPGSTSCVINNSYFKGNFITNDTGIGGAIDSVASHTQILNTTFEDNHAREGGAIFIGGVGGNATIFNSTFSNNYATVSGGAIDLNASAVNVTYSQFYDNNAHDGGAIYVGGTGQTNYIYRSAFERNNATGGRGGAINWLASEGVILESNFTENYATYGGAVYMGGTSSGSQINKVIFDSNFAYENGGAIDWNSTGGQLHNTLFINNKAKYGAALCRESNATNGGGKNNTFISNHAFVAGAGLAWMSSAGIKINNYSFIDNTADGTGAAIYIGEDSHSCVIFNSTFRGNHLTNMTEGHNGGAIDCRAVNTTVNMSSFDNNGAYAGGAIYVGGLSGNTKILGSNFTNNYAVGYGGAIVMAASDISVDGSLFDSNRAENGDGGAIYVGGQGETNLINDSVFNNNRALNGHGGAIEWVAYAGNITDSDFTNNRADYGGALHLAGLASSTRLTDILFENNTATTNGGAMDSNATFVEIYNIRFITNYAKYGAALCRESGATGGSGRNNTFIGNDASYAGAGLAWMNVSNIKITNYTFINNTAAEHGGAIYVMEGSDNCKVYECYFEGNEVPTGHGGAIDWAGHNGEIVNTTFLSNSAEYAGAVLICDHAENMTIASSNFTDCHATKTSGGAIEACGQNSTIKDCNFISCSAVRYGGSIAGFNACNATLSNLTFKYSIVHGSRDAQGVDHGEGGAIYWENVTGLIISDMEFVDNEARLQGGSISLNNCNDSVLSNLTFELDFAEDYGGSICWYNSTNATIQSCSFNDCKAIDNGGAIYLANIDANVTDCHFDHIQTSLGAGGAVYIDGNVTVSDSTFANCSSLNNKATAIMLAGGNSTVVDSTFSCINPVFIADGAGANLTRNVADGSASGMYSVWNDGDLWLEKNVFDNYIYNNGTIWTQTYTKFLDNKTWNGTWNETFDFWANITDDNNNAIISVATLMSENAEKVGEIYYPMYYNKVTERLIYQGVFHIGGYDTGLMKNNVTPGTLQVKIPTNIKLNITKTNEGEKVVIEAIVYPKGNFTIATSVLITVMDSENNVIFNDYVNINNITSTATLELRNLVADTYTVTASYPGSNYYFGSDNDTFFIIKLRQNWIKIVVDDMIYGQYVLANVTTGGNGTVLVYVGGKNKTARVSNGYAIINLTEVIGGHLEPGNWSIGAVYMQDEYFSYALNQTSFNIAKLNTTIIANCTPHIVFGQNQVINVTVNENATGFVAVRIGDDIQVAYVINGTAQIILEKIDVGNYTNITVTFYPGDNHFNGNATNISFVVGPTGDYNMSVKADDITYGQNATVRVLLPEWASGNVTIWVDNKKYENITIGTGGVALLENITGLAGGSHKVNVTYNGCSLYAPKDGNTTFFVKPTTDWKMSITVEEHVYGENTTINVTTLPYHVGGNNVTLNISGVIYVVNLTDGRATLVLNNLTTGMHSATANYAGDANYSAKTQIFRVHVTKATPTITLNNVSGNIVATVSGNTTGNVTFYIHGLEYTADLSAERTAILPNEYLRIGNNSVVAVYNGDANYFSAKTMENFTVDKLNSHVNVTANDTVYGNEVEIVVRVGENQTGFVKIIVNGKSYIDVLDEGVAKFYVSGLNVGNYTVNVTYYGDNTFYANKNFTSFNVTPAEMSATVTARNVTVEENGSFTIRDVNPRDFDGNVRITINGTEYYNGDVYSPIEIARILKAGKYSANVTFYGDKNYNNRTYIVNFTVSRVTPQINVTIEDVTYPENATAHVNVSNKANGTIEIYEGTRLIGTASIVNGTATVNITRLAAGSHDVTVRFISGDDYNSNVSTAAGFHVNKGNTSVAIIRNGTDVIAVVTPGVSGNVTFIINGEELLNATVNGNATIKGKLHIGNNTVTVICRGNENYTGCDNATVFEIVKITTDLSVEVAPVKVVVGKNTTITVTMVNVTSGKVLIEVGGFNYAVNINANGIATLTVALPVGNHTAKAYYLGDLEHEACTNTSAKFEVVDKQNATVIINADKVVEIEHDLRFNVTNSTPVVVTINGVVIKPDADGNYTFHATKVGNYTIVVRSNETDEYYAGFNQTTFVVVKHNATVTIDVDKLHEIESVFNINVTNDTVVNVTINGKVYDVVNGKVVIDTTETTLLLLQFMNLINMLVTVLLRHLLFTNMLLRLLKLLFLMLLL